MTKAINVEDDDGYIGNFLFYEVWDWMGGIPDLINNKKINVYIVELFMGFSLEPKNGQINFSVIPVDLKGEFAENIINRYPCGIKGCSIPAKLFYNESIKMGREFLKDITKRYYRLSQHGEIEKFRNTLINAEEAVDEYYKTH